MLMLFTMFYFFMMYTMYCMQFMVFSKNLSLIFKIQFFMTMLLIFMWIMIMLSYDKLFKMKSNFFVLMNNMLFSIMLVFFLSMSYLMFFILFEMSLMLMIMLILGFGYNFEKIEASYYMFLYTLLFSMPFFLSILFLISKNINLFIIYKINPSMLMLIMTTFVFFVKSPFYFFHLWLPKAHVESMSMGSIILATIMLKMGTYGLFITIFLFKKHWFFMKFIFIMLIFSMFISNFIIMFQIDMKKLIAYYSISHMTMLGFTIFLKNIMSYNGFVFMNISHYFSSNLLFFFSGIFFKEYYSRSLFFIKGMNYLSMMMIFFFLSIILNFSFPPFITFFSEMLIFKSMLTFFNVFFIFLLIVLMIFCFSSLFFYNLFFLGKFFNSKKFVSFMKKEYLYCMYFFIMSFLTIFML